MEYKIVTIKIPIFRWRYFRISLKSLLLLVLVAALAMGWLRDHHRLSQEIYLLQNPKSGWSTNQVLGPPDTPGSGDLQTAWASKTTDGQDEWLILEYRRAVRPAAVKIHETYNPGAVSKVSVFDEENKEHVAWTGLDPTPQTSKRGVSVIPLDFMTETKRIKIYLDSMAVPGWNEIDAVGLVDTAGKTQWAQRAYASSSYGKNNPLDEEYTFGGLTFAR